jgi:hypothetical protein
MLYCAELCKEIVAPVSPVGLDVYSTDVFKQRGDEGRMEKGRGGYFYLFSRNLPKKKVTASSTINLPSQAQLDRLNSADGVKQLRTPEFGFPIILGAASLDVFVAYDTGASDSHNARNRPPGSTPGWFPVWYTSDVSSASQPRNFLNMRRVHGAQSVVIIATADPITGNVTVTYKFFSGKDATGQQRGFTQTLEFTGDLQPGFRAAADSDIFRIGRWAAFIPLRYDEKGSDVNDNLEITGAFKSPRLTVDGRDLPWNIEAGWKGQPRNVHVEVNNARVGTEGKGYVSDGELVRIKQTTDYSVCYAPKAQAAGN